MILRFSPHLDSPHNQIFKKTGRKKAEPNNLILKADGQRGAVGSRDSESRKLSVCLGVTITEGIENASLHYLLLNSE
jgi:hypothetical protein